MVIRSLHLFCRVVDNYGDIGVCWRLARQFAAEHGLAVTLWVDDLQSFHRICAGVDPLRDVQQIEQVNIFRWTGAPAVIEAPEVADVVVEAFACELPEAYARAMAARASKPVWLNLEYLSAEAWVEDCHAMTSPHPALPLVKYFFFPGFSGGTGGLPAERDLQARRAAFQADAAAPAEFLAGLGVRNAERSFLMSLFCYPSAPAASLFESFASGSAPALCLVPEGVAGEAVEAFLKGPARPGAQATRGNITVQVIPFVDQPDYDRLLWACDLNFVRGEDSFVRAQWASRPFVWQIYPQDDDAHLTKMRAFLARYRRGMADDDAGLVTAAWNAWNGDRTNEADWPAYRSAQPRLRSHATGWAEQLARNGDLASNLLQFAKKFS